MRLFKKQKPHIYTMSEHSGWGNSIAWTNWDRREVCGFLRRIPQKGDILKSEMTSGKIARFKFVKIRRCEDPRDMFFATVKDLKYEDNSKKAQL